MNQLVSLLSLFHGPGPDLKVNPGASIQAWEVSSSMLSGFVNSGKMPELMQVVNQKLLLLLFKKSLCNILCT